MTEEQWTAIWQAAGGIKSIAGSIPIPNSPIMGRWIAVLAEKLVAFWGKHRDTLAPYLAQATIAALEALIAVLPDILAVNRKGPG